MPLFLFLNDLAGRNALLDLIARYFFVSGVPLLGTLLLAQLTLFWPQNSRVSRSKLVLALFLALALGALLLLGVAWLQNALGGVLSPRPFMTRRVNLLVVEPQDNSFPAPELIFAAIFAFASWQLSRKIGILSFALAILLGLTRLFCGTNYLADVAFGFAFGIVLAALAFAFVRLQPPKVRARQAGLAMGGFGALVLGLFLAASGEARFAQKIYGGAKVPASSENTLSDADAASSLLLSKREHLYLPEVEQFLTGKLAPLARPFRLLGVEVAPVKAGDSAYRVAAIRFEIQPDGPELRAKTAAVAARLVKAAFALDSRLENVDVVAILRGEPGVIDGSLMRFVGDETPVFTASIQRKNLVVPGNAWANSAQIDGGSWLRFRSRLWINERVLPQTPREKNEPKAPVSVEGKL